jgi:hypothetical protein
MCFMELLFSEPRLRVLDIGIFPKAKLDHGLAILVGEGLTNRLFEADDIPRFHLDVDQITVDGKVITVADEDHDVCTRDRHHRAYLPFKYGANDGPIVGTDFNMRVVDNHAFYNRVLVLPELSL